VLARCHDIRNRGEYEGDLSVDEQIVPDLITACRTVADKLDTLPPPCGGVGMSAPTKHRLFRPAPFLTRSRNEWEQTTVSGSADAE
jgi:hypothetical protein